MIDSSMNQIANAKNPYQGGAERVLCICSAGLLRSPTIAEVLTRKGYNTRAVGAATEYALIPVSSALLIWAERYVVVKEQENVLISYLKDLAMYDKVKHKITVLDIPDSFERNDPELIEIIQKELKDW